MARFTVTAYNYSPNNWNLCSSYRFAPDPLLSLCVVQSYPFPRATSPATPGKQTFSWEPIFSFAALFHRHGHVGVINTTPASAQLNATNIIVDRDLIHFTQTRQDAPEDFFMIETDRVPMPSGNHIGIGSFHTRTVCCFVKDTQPNSRYLFRPTGPLSIFFASNSMTGSVITPENESRMFDLNFPEGETNIEVSLTPQSVWQLGRMQ
ncbi:MAG: hypothetical protein J0I41_16295 [Filimonas sp.]|nr:hypothetical protein [Filimonas sp.]